MLTCTVRRVHHAVPSQLALYRTAVLSRQCLPLQLLRPISSALQRASTLHLPHTARTLATAAAPTTKSPKAKSAAAPKRKLAAKKKVAKKAKKPKKPKKKAVKKPKKAKKPAKVLTADEKEKLLAKKLREKALLSTPKQLPADKWKIFIGESMQKGLLPEQIGDITRSKSAAYKSLGAADLERLNHLANENAKANHAALEAWLQGYTPEQIRAANSARRALGRLAKARKARGAKGIQLVKHYKPISDARAVKGRQTPFALFTKARHASGDLKGIKIAEAGQLVGREWRALTETEKQQYGYQVKR